MPIVFYVVNQLNSLYRIEEGVGITHTFTPSGTTVPPLGVTHDGHGRIITTGEPFIGSGSTYSAAFGYALDANDLTLLDPMWGQDSGGNTGEWTDVDDPPRVHTHRAPFECGLLYDPDHNEVLISGILRGHPAPSADQDTEDQVMHLSPDGVFLRGDADSSTPPAFISVTNNKGVALLDGWFYYVYEGGSIARYNTTTGLVEAAFRCFDDDEAGRTVDLQADDKTGKLWKIQESSDTDGNARARSFYPADVPWGTSFGPLPTYIDQVLLINDFDPPYYWGNSHALQIIGNKFLFSCRDWDTSSLIFITVPMAGGSPTVVFFDASDIIEDAWDIFAFPITAFPLRLKQRDDSIGHNIEGGSTPRLGYLKGAYSTSEQSSTTPRIQHNNEHGWS